ncbi:MAG: HNH endonuclease [Selenomonadaceae bacterium]|nr:HNH endonuclease [Selenomonadaceae bacterium]
MSYRDEWFKHNQSDHGWYTCARCGKKIRKADADIDHIVPQKYGGSDRLFNLQCLCKHCNRSKQASMRDTVPDLVKTNSKRAVKGIAKNLTSVAKKIVKGKKK